MPDEFEGRTEWEHLDAGALYICIIAVLRKDIWEFKKENHIQQDDKHLIVL